MTPEQEIRDAIHEIRGWMKRICTEFDEYRDHMKQMQVWLNAHDQHHILEDATRDLVQKNANLVKTNEQLLTQLEQRRASDRLWHGRFITVGKGAWAVVIALLSGAIGGAILNHFFQIVSIP